MTLRLRKARWAGDQTKHERLAAILKDPVFTEALELVFHESRTRYLGDGVLPAEMLMRRQCELTGMQMLLDELERHTLPSAQEIEPEQEWDCYSLTDAEKTLGTTPDTP